MFLEKGYRPRCECGDEKKSVHSCYMYQPVKPVSIAKNKDDKRPQFGPWIISARSHFVDIPELELNAEKTKNGSILFWIPKKGKKNVKTKKTSIKN